MRYWRWTHDDDFMREIAYDGVKRHLAWMDRNMKVPDAELYENWLNTWNTDDKWCNGGAGTISSAYYAFDCRVMSEVAQRLGKTEDAAYFAARSKAVEDAIAKSLWHEGDGVWGEYRERFGLKRLMRAPDLSTVNGRPVMFGEIATHGNAHAIALDPAKELKSLRVECRGTETFVGLLAATLYR